MSLLFFVAVTILACRPPKQAILIFIVVPLLLPIMYCTMEKKHEKYPVVTKATKRESVKYTPLYTSPDEESHVSSETKVELSVRDKVDAVWEALPFALSMITGYFSSYFTLQSVVTTLAFPDAPFGPRNHYIFYTLVFMTGNLIGRTYAWILAAIDEDCRPFTRHTWIFSSLLAVILVFLVLGSWYRFLASVWIVLALMFIVGLLTGLLYINSYVMAGARETIRAKTELSRAFTYSGFTIGVLAAAVLGMRTEPLLKEHCMQITARGAYCLTRYVNGLNSTFLCRK